MHMHVACVKCALVICNMQHLFCLDTVTLDSTFHTDSKSHTFLAAHIASSCFFAYLRVVHVDLVAVRYRRPIALVDALLQPTHAVPQPQRVLLAAEAAQHLERNLDAVAQPLAAGRLHADGDLFGRLDDRRLVRPRGRLADHLRCDDAKDGRFGGGGGERQSRRRRRGLLIGLRHHRRRCESRCAHQCKRNNVQQQHLVRCRSGVELTAPHGEQPDVCARGYVAPFQSFSQRRSGVMVMGKGVESGDRKVATVHRRVDELVCTIAGGELFNCLLTVEVACNARSHAVTQLTHYYMD